MTSRWVISFFIAVLFVQGTIAAAPPPAMPPTASPSATPTFTAPTSTYAPEQLSGSAVLPRAREWLHRVQTGDLDRSQLSAAANAAFTAQMAETMKRNYGRLGSPIAFTFLSEQSLGDGNTAYTYRVRFKHAMLIEKFVLDGAGKISGLSFAPAS